MGFNSRRFSALLTFTAVLAVATVPASAVVPPDRIGTPGEKVLYEPLYIGNLYASAAQLPEGFLPGMEQDLSSLGVAPEASYLDRRTGRWGALMPATPLLPGTGVGNRLSWDSLNASQPESLAAYKEAAWSAFVGYLRVHPELQIDIAELTQPGNVTVHDGGNLIQINARRQISGVEVRDSFLTAVINHGNLVLFGARNWNDVTISVEPLRTPDQSLAAARDYMHPWVDLGNTSKTDLVLVPVARGSQPDQIQVGEGLDYRLVHVIKLNYAGEGANYEALVDAHNGEVISLKDTNHYLEDQSSLGSPTARTVSGGVLPVSNDGMVPDGVEQAGWPMPNADVTFGGSTQFTDEGGNLLTCVDGTITSTLSGQYMNMVDNCGAISLSGTGNLDFGVSPATDCSTPGVGGPGNTRASRSGFYEIGRIKEMGRAQLPANTWLQGQLTATMNINQTCNANWNGVGVNFYRSGGGCNNTGELAGVFDHEWGHGMDANDANPGISNSGEGIADIYAALRLNDSCMGRNFRGTPCGGYGDPCTVCTGVRDTDFANRASGNPHDIAFIDGACGGGPAPCGGGVHCEGAVQGESVWDLVHRDFQAAPYNYDLNTALEISTRLTFLGAGPVGNWFNCVNGSGMGDGCNADGGYLNYLAADDDNGNLADGTPHIEGIFSAFDRHGIACATPTPTDSGCAGTPATAPVVAGAAIDRGADLSWAAVAGATKYKIYRTDGVFGCDFGKILVGETTGLTFQDSGLQNGRDYFYTVAAIGPADSCFSPLSACTTVTPSAGANLALDSSSVAVSISTGDSDDFLDNCETASIAFDLVSLGTGSQTNVRIVSVDPVSHPSTTINTSLPLVIAPTLASCDTAPASVLFQAEGLSFDETLEFVVEFTSDELAPSTKTATVTVENTESDVQNFATRTFSFETDEEGWSVDEGVFGRTGTGGGDGSTWFLDSSDNLDSQCDRARSPLMRLSATSTLSLWNNFDIEPLSGGTWYDRANVGLVEADDTRTLVTPDGGRTYNADSSGPGNYTGCNEPEEGWAGTSATWASSSWSATALQSAIFAGDFVQLEVIYGTDGALANRGFWFDEVTVTDVDFQVADVQSDICAANIIFVDGFESGDTSAWTLTFP
ncbi:MAG: immune inhibitor A [Deltaproteobacteria bacterium]|nr:immune inhibitor A [Deltaproteobacteria bacterium]